jgi:hypothetical protein
VNLTVTTALGGRSHGTPGTFADVGRPARRAARGHQSTPARERLSPFWQCRITFVLITLGWVFFVAPNFVRAASRYPELGTLPQVGLAAATKARDDPLQPRARLPAQG